MSTNKPQTAHDAQVLLKRRPPSVVQPAHRPVRLRR